MTALVPSITSTPVAKRAAIVFPSSGNIAEDVRSKAGLVAHARAGGLTLTVMLDAVNDRKKILLAAVNGGFEVLLVPSINVLGKDLASAVEAVLQLSAAGVDLRSMAEPWLDFT